MALLMAACSSGATTKAVSGNGNGNVSGNGNGTSARTSTSSGASTTDAAGGRTWKPQGKVEQASFDTEKQIAADYPPGAKKLHFEFGPIDIAPGQNQISYSGRNVPKPPEDGYILRIEPNIKRVDGTVPPVDVIHLHHGVWVNLSAKDPTSPHLPERFFASGEEKTTIELPKGFGYAFKATDNWLINYMIHNLLPAKDKIVITYDMVFLPATDPAAASIRPARPIWMDVVNGSIYPVFDVLKGSGTNGTYTYPDQAVDPYKGRKPLNQWTVDRPSVIVGAGGHLHPGGLHDDLYVQRNGASAAPGSPAAGSVQGDKARLFTSAAHYWEPAGAVSWDVAMTVTNPDYRVALQPGDVLSMSTTYDSKRASWYESMGIMNLWLADGTDGANPFETPVDGPGHLTHGHLPENNNHGGDEAIYTDPAKRKSAPAAGAIDISKYVYTLGDMTNDTPILSVVQGQSLTFDNKDDAEAPGAWHSITACKAPCNKKTGVAYPLADGDVNFDSGQLGNRGVPTAGRETWQTPADLTPGTYTYFCRIHPFMRGAFTVTAKS